MRGFDLYSFVKKSLTLGFIVGFVSLKISAEELRNPFDLGLPIFKGKSKLYCPQKNLYKPVLKELIIDGKYDKNDPTHSKPNPKPIRGLKTQNDIANFAKKLSRFSDIALDETKKPKVRYRAYACFKQNLHNWAKEEALLNVKANSQGQAIRKWFLGSLSAVSLKMIANSDFVLGEVEKKWLDDIAHEVKKHYHKRYTKRVVYFNNHDHWAIYAVGLNAILQNRKEDLLWVREVFDFALTRTKEDESSKTLYLPRETRRGHLGVVYMNFSLTPLLFTAHFLHQNSMLDKPRWEKLRKIAHFTHILNTNPQKLSLRFEQAQKKAKIQSQFWILPYLILTKKFQTPKQISQKFSTKKKNWRIGGDIQRFYRY